MRQTLRLIGKYATPILMVAVMVALPGGAFSDPTTNVIPWYDDFEWYAEGTPLIDGTNGWYGNSSSIIVQTNTVCTGTKAAMIPEDCILSNQFQNDARTNVLIQMDLWPSLYDGTNSPVVDTNNAALFFVDSNGNFVVHDGPTANPTNSIGWVMTTNGCIGTNGAGWVRLQVRINYELQTWALFNASTKVMVTNNIRFVNANLTNFSGFDAYSGSETSYLDNVSVTEPSSNEFLNVIPVILTNSVMRGFETNSVLDINNKGATNMVWSAYTTDAWIQIVGATNGGVVGGGTTNLMVVNSSAALANGTYTGRVMVSATSADAYFSPEQSVVTFVLHVMDLQRSPAQLTNSVMQGDAASDYFEVWNAGEGGLDYTVTTAEPWLTLNQSGGSLTGQTPNVVWVTYTNTASLLVGVNSGTVTISSSAGGVVTKTVAVKLTVRPLPLLNLNPAVITNAVMEGQNLASQVLRVWNESSTDGMSYQVATNGGWAWLSVQVTNNYLAARATNILTVQYAVSSLMAAGNAPSNYTGAIVVTATNASGLAASGSPFTIPVTVQVNPKPRLAISLTNLSQTVLQGRNAASQWFEVWNSNAFSTLNYAISKGDAAWLVLTPTNGTSTGQHVPIQVQYSTVNLPAGFTNAVISVVDVGQHVTQRIAVALSVTPFATLATDAHSMSYSVRKGMPSPEMAFNVWNGGHPPNAMYFTVSPSASWLKLTRSSGTSTGNLVNVQLQADTTGMSPGVHSGTVQIDATDANSGEAAYGSPQMFTITVDLRNLKGFDFQGGSSGASDLVVYREANGSWVITNLLSGYATNITFGGNGYQAVPGDYSGDGVTDLGVYRRASGGWYAWQLEAQSMQYVEMQRWIGQDYMGVPGDYDGDGLIDPGVYMEASGLWSVLLSGSGYQETSVILGGPGYEALRSGDYDGDRKVDPSVYHRASGLLVVLMSGTSYATVSGILGNSGCEPVPADYDGDDLTDPAVYEISTGRWYVLPSTTLSSQGYSLVIYVFGGVPATWVPAPGDYDGDGLANLALYDTTTGSWYIKTAWGIWWAPLGGFGYGPVRP